MLSRHNVINSFIINCYSLFINILIISIKYSDSFKRLILFQIVNKFLIEKFISTKNV